MAAWFGDDVNKWHWIEQRVWWPFLQCERSYKFLFLKKAYYGKRDYYGDMWLSKEEFMFAKLRGEFE